MATRRQPLVWAEAAALTASTLAVTYLATNAASSSLLFLVFPFLIWASFRFEHAGAAPCALAISTLAILASGRMTGPFDHHNLLTNMVTLQAFNGTVSLTALVLTAVVTERNRTHEEIERLCAQLSTAVTNQSTGSRHVPRIPDPNPNHPLRSARSPSGGRAGSSCPAVPRQYRGCLTLRRG